MKKWAYLLAFLVTVLVVVAWQFIHTTTTIYKTPWGYFPSEIKVVVGTEVTYKNLTKQYMWPASDLHPSHDAYSDFDSKEPIAPNESWSFVFERRGVWTYHDHLSAQLTGRVIVRDESGSTVFDCTGIDKSACWVADIEFALVEGGVEAAFKSLVRIHETYPEFATYCHNYAHDIGLKAFVHFGKNVEFGPETSYCNAGFYHGFVEGLVDSNNDIKEVEEFCISTGERLAEGFPLAEQQCRHGIGHASIEYYMHRYPELIQDPEELISKSLGICRLLESEGDEDMRCASGVFNVYRDLLTATQGFDAFEQGQEIFGLCSRLELDYEKEGCYWELAKLYSSGEYVNSVLQSLSDGEEVIEVLSFERFISEEDKNLFMKKIIASWSIPVGKWAVNEYDTDVVLAVCDLVQNKLRVDCLKGLVEGAFSASSPFEEHLTIVPMCNNVTLTEKDIQVCYKVYQQNLYTSYDTLTRRNQCALIPSLYLDDYYCS